MIFLTYILIVLYTLYGAAKLGVIIYNDIRTRKIKVIYCPINDQKENGECLYNILRFKYPHADIRRARS